MPIVSNYLGAEGLNVILFAQIAHKVWVLLQIKDTDPGSRLGKYFRNAAAYAPGSASHDGDFVLETNVAHLKMTSLRNA